MLPAAFVAKPFSKPFIQKDYRQETGLCHCLPPKLAALNILDRENSTLLPQLSISSGSMPELYSAATRQNISNLQAINDNGDGRPLSFDTNAAHQLPLPDFLNYATRSPAQLCNFHDFPAPRPAFSEISNCSGGTRHADADGHTLGSAGQSTKHCITEDYSNMQQR
jgi:hypothetical protein